MGSEGRTPRETMVEQEGPQCFLCDFPQLVSVQASFGMIVGALEETNHDRKLCVFFGKVLVWQHNVVRTVNNHSRMLFH